MSKDKPRHSRSVQYLGYSVDGQSHPVQRTDTPHASVPFRVSSTRWALPTTIIAASLILIVAGVATAPHPKPGPPTVGTVQSAFIDLKQGAPLEIKASRVVLLLQRHGNAVMLSSRYLGNLLAQGHLSLSWGKLTIAQQQPLNGSARLVTAFSQLPPPRAPIRAVWTINGVLHQATTSLASAYHMQVVQGRLFTGVRNGWAVAFQEQILKGPGVVQPQGNLSIHYGPAKIPAGLMFTLDIRGVPTTVHYLGGGSPHTVTDRQMPMPAGHPIHPIIHFRWNNGQVSLRLNPQALSSS